MFAAIFFIFHHKLSSCWFGFGKRPGVALIWRAGKPTAHPRVSTSTFRRGALAREFYNMHNQTVAYGAMGLRSQVEKPVHNRIKMRELGS